MKLLPAFSRGWAKFKYLSLQAVNNKLTKKRLTRIDKLIKLLRELEYDLIIRKMEHPF